MTVSTRIAIIGVGDPGRHADGVSRAVLSRLRERATGRPLYRLGPDTAALWRAGSMHPHGPGEAVAMGRELGHLAECVEAEIVRHRAMTIERSASRAPRGRGRT